MTVEEERNGDRQSGEVGFAMLCCALLREHWLRKVKHRPSPHGKARFRCDLEK